MSDVIRHGTIVVDLVQGKVALTPPDMGPVLSARQKEIELINQIEAGQKRLIDLQNEMLRPRDGGGATPGSGDGGAIPGLPSPEEVDEAAKAQRELSIAYRETGEGVLRVARGMVLLGGAGSESLQKMVRGLAVVQGAFDLFAGSQKIIDNLAKAHAALAAAQAAQTAATATNTAATVANTTVTTAMTGAKLGAAAATTALATVMNPVTLGLIAIGSAVMAVVEAYDFFTESSDEAREAVLAQAQVTTILTGAMANQLATERQIADLRRTTMSDVEKRASLDREAINARASGVLEIDLASGKAPEAELVARNFAAQQFAAAASALRERDSVEKSILDTQTRQKENTIEAIKRQDQLLQSAQRQLDVEKQKSDQQQSQIGRLSKLQQEQLRSLRDRLLRGEDLSRGEEERLEELGGEQGRAIVDARARRRAEAAGFGPDFFKGIEGASDGLEKTTEKVKELTNALKALGGVGRIAELEAEKKNLETSFADFRKSLSVQIEETIKLMQSNAERIHELEITTAINAAQQ